MTDDNRPLREANKQEFRDAFGMMQRAVHRNAKAKGWWDAGRNDGEAIALMHSELSEALEAMRDGMYFDGQELICGCVGHVSCDDDGAEISVEA